MVALWYICTVIVQHLSYPAVYQRKYKLKSCMNKNTPGYRDLKLAASHLWHLLEKTTFLKHLSSLLLLANKTNNDSKKITLDNVTAQRQVPLSAIMHIRDISYQEDIQNEVRMVGCAERARLFRKLVPSDGGALQTMGCLFTSGQTSEELSNSPSRPELASCLTPTALCQQPKPYLLPWWHRKSSEYSVFIFTMDKENRLVRKSLRFVSHIQTCCSILHLYHCYKLGDEVKYELYGNLRQWGHKRLLGQFK